MDTRSRRCFAGMVLALLADLGGASIASEDRYLGYTGIAAEPHSTTFLYGERHVLRLRDDRVAERVVLYTCRDGSTFARKIVRYVDPLAPDFEFEDASNGVRQGIRSDGPNRLVFFRSGGTAMEKAAPLPQTPGLVADAGFDEFIRANWLALMGGKSLALHFLLPSRLEDITFEVHHQRADQAQNEPVEVFRLKPAGAWGWLVRPIDVSYAAGDRVLLSYEGISDLRDAAGNNLQTLINFRSSDRTVSDAQSMTGARQAPLRACKG